MHYRYHEPSLDSRCAMQHDAYVSSIFLQENRFNPPPGGYFFACLLLPQDKDVHHFLSASAPAVLGVCAWTRPILRMKRLPKAH
jgi:hypothetical protein